MAWNAYLPCAEAIVRMIELAGDDAGAARDRLEHAFALDCQIRDCCWEGIGAAGLALLEEVEGVPTPHSSGSRTP